MTDLSTYIFFLQKSKNSEQGNIYSNLHNLGEDVALHQVQDLSPSWMVSWHWEWYNSEPGWYDKLKGIIDMDITSIPNS